MAGSGWEAARAAGATCGACSSVTAWLAIPHALHLLPCKTSVSVYHALVIRLQFPLQNLAAAAYCFQPTCPVGAQ